MNACVPTCQWKGVSWVFHQIRRNGLRPNGASYGLAMEVTVCVNEHKLCLIVVLVELRVVCIAFWLDEEGFLEMQTADVISFVVMFIIAWLCLIIICNMLRFFADIMILHIMNEG